MNIIWASPARRRLASIIEHIAEENPVAAIELDEEIDRKLQQLEKFPYSGRAGKVAGTREAVIGKYILIYEIRDDNLIIDYIYHGAMQYPPKSPAAF